MLIAEVACTWRTDSGPLKSGEWQRLCLLADDVKAAGFDAFKIQWTSDAQAMARRRRMPDHRPYLPLEFEPAWLGSLSRLCTARDLQPMVTVYLPEDVAVIAPLVSCYKVASLEADSPTLFEAYQRVPPRPIYISTGARDEAGLVRTMTRWGSSRYPASFLHCVATYPASLSSLHLQCLQQYGLDGFSDHTGHEWTGAFAVMAGAHVIEVHVRPVECPPDNADVGHSLHGEGMKRYVEHARLAAIVLGAPLKRLDPSESALLPHLVTD